MKKNENRAHKLHHMLVEMTEQYYKSISMDEIYKHPEKYAWNCLLYYKQFSKDELLHFKEYIEVVELIKHQHVASVEFLRTHFTKEIDECLEVDWDDVKKYASNRE
jgi:hypothetical protein